MNLPPFSVISIKEVVSPLEGRGLLVELYGFMFNPSKLTRSLPEIHTSPLRSQARETGFPKEGEAVANGTVKCEYPTFLGPGVVDKSGEIELPEIPKLKGSSE